MNILETKDLTFGYSGHNVLSSVNLEIREGERHAVIGPNGAGKTTLFNVITGTYKSAGNGTFLSDYQYVCQAVCLSKCAHGNPFQKGYSF